MNTTSTSTTEQAKPSVARGEIGSRLIGITLVVVWLLFWEWIVRFGLGQKFFSSPSNIFALFYQSLLVTGELRTPLFATVTRLVGGLMIGVVPALSLGFIMGNRRAWLRYDPFFTVLGLIPTLAALPWFIIMFGVGDFGKWMIVGAAVFYPILHCTTKGCADLPRCEGSEQFAGRWASGKQLELQCWPVELRRTKTRRHHRPGNASRCGDVRLENWPWLRGRRISGSVRLRERLCGDVRGRFGCLRFVALSQFIRTRLEP